MRFQPARLQACLAALSAAGGGFSDIEPAYRGACLAPFEGSLAANERCESDAECASGACALTCDGTCCESRCGERDAELGAACEASQDCVAGAFCEQGACASLRREGEPCLTGGAATCEDPLWCIAGVCTTPPRVGEACNRSAFYASCDELGAVCDDQTLKCIRVAPVGEPCSGEGPGCVGSATCREGVCAPLPELHEPCEDQRCLGDLVCDAAARCALPAVPAEPVTPGGLACP